MCRSTRLLLIALPLVAAACGGGEGHMSVKDPLSARELEATRLVESETGDVVLCRDNGAVNSELAPDHPIGYSCFNQGGEFYNIVVTPDGGVISFSGPVCIQGRGSEHTLNTLGFENVPDCSQG